MAKFDAINLVEGCTVPYGPYILHYEGEMYPSRIRADHHWAFFSDAMQCSVPIPGRKIAAYLIECWQGVLLGGA